MQGQELQVRAPLILTCRLDVGEKKGWLGGTAVMC